MIDIVTECWVPGHPKTKGSMVAVGKQMRQSVAGSTTWARLVAQRVRADRAARGLLLPCALPVSVRLAFWLWPPGDLIGTGRAAMPTWQGAGDLDKLTRNVLDALDGEHGKAYVNDNQVCSLRVDKYAADMGHEQGVLIQCWVMSETEAWARLRLWNQPVTALWGGV